MQIINTHCHVYPERVAMKAAENIGKFYRYPVPDFEQGTPGTLDLLLAESSPLGITTFAVSGAATAPKQVTSVNDFFIDLAGKQFGAELICYGTAHPDFPNIGDEIERIKSLGLRGLKLHADCQAFNIDDPKAYAIYEAAQAVNIPILMHLGDETHDFSAPRRLVNVSKDFPKLRLIAAHLGGYRDWDNALLLKGLDNVWFDTCSSQSILPPERVVSQIRTFGAERCFFGTDYPLWKAKEELAAFMSLPLTDNEKEMILAKNYRLFIDD